MNYFLKGLRDNTKKFWVVAGISGFAAVAIVDVFAAGLGGSIFELKIFKAFIVFLVLGVIALIIYKVVTEQKARQLDRKAAEEAAIFEPKREAEIRQILAENPGFLTLCYKCIYFNHDKLHCGRDMMDERVKQVSINDRKYCLYWAAAPDPQE